MKKSLLIWASKKIYNAWTIWKKLKDSLLTSSKKYVYWTRQSWNRILEKVSVKKYKNHISSLVNLWQKNAKSKSIKSGKSITHSFKIPKWKSLRNSTSPLKRDAEMKWKTSRLYKYQLWLKSNVQRRKRELLILLLRLLLRPLRKVSDIDTDKSVPSKNEFLKILFFSNLRMTATRNFLKKNWNLTHSYKLMVDWELTSKNTKKANLEFPSSSFRMKHINWTVSHLLLWKMAKVVTILSKELLKNVLLFKSRSQW